MTQGSNGPDGPSLELPPEQEARMLAALRSLGDPRPQGEMDDAAMLARVLAAASEERRDAASADVAASEERRDAASAHADAAASEERRDAAASEERRDAAASEERRDAARAGAPVISLVHGAPGAAPGGDAPAASIGRPRSRPTFRRGVAMAFAGFAIAASVAYAAQQYVRSLGAPPAPPEPPAPSGAPQVPGAAPRPAPAPSETASTTTDDPPAPSSSAAPEEPAPSAVAPPPPPTADDLLKRAQRLYTAGDMAGATAAYRALVARYPGSGEARAALISLGQLALSGGRAQEALADFDRYLASGGPLSTEARVGRIGALRALGRTADERAAIEDFLARSGGGVHAARLRVRLAELEGR